MYFWPESSGLSEVGAAPAAGSSAAGMGGMSGMGGGAMGPGGAPSPMGAGEVILSRAESAALAALEFEGDEKHGRRRARAESGLSDQQIDRLKRRADTAVSKGYILKGQGFTKKPTAGDPDQPGLTKKALVGKDAKAEDAGLDKGDDKVKKATPAKAGAVVRAKETAHGALFNRVETGEPLLYQTSTVAHRVPTPSSEGRDDNPDHSEANVASTLSGMAGVRRRAARRR